MAALQYVDVPGYSALILRRDYARLALPGAIMDRAREWLSGTPATWHEQKKLFTFPSGATLQFGYIDNAVDRFRYGSAEFHFIGWDELTEFSLPDDDSNPYLFMFSRNRATVDCKIPLRIRAAGNPGGVGHAFVKRRFVPPEYLNADLATRFSRTWEVGERIFLPARREDNLSLDQTSYDKSLSQLHEKTRLQLREGDWREYEGGIFFSHWFRNYEMQGDYYRLYGPSGDVELYTVHKAKCRRFMTTDTAASSKDVDRAKKGHASWTAIGTWDVTPKGDLIAVEVERFQEQYPEIRTRALAAHERLRPAFVAIEDKSTGQALLPDLRALGISTRPLNPGQQDKLARAATIINRCQQGTVYLPRAAAWRDDFQAELVQWTGDKDETFDMGDAFAYAGILMSDPSVSGGGGFKVSSYGGV